MEHKNDSETEKNAKIPSPVTEKKNPKAIPASFLFWKIQSDLSKAGLKLAKIHEQLETLEETQEKETK